MFNLWFIVAGVVLLFMALSSSVFKRMPVTTTMFYLAFGFMIGPAGLQLIKVNPLVESTLIERLTEIAVIISLFSSGLKLRTPISDPLWRFPVRLAFGSMTLTVALVALVGVFGLGLPLGAAVLLGAVLAPTDPVLASGVQMENPYDRDRLRFSLTGEAGLNDGTAFPFVMLGLGLLGLHQTGEFGWRWLAVDLVWAIVGGLGIGSLLGTLIGYLVIYLRREHKEAVGLDDFLALGLIAFSYGIALSVNTYGFLSVFASGLALRRLERRVTGEMPSEEVEEMSAVGKLEEIATDPEKAPAHMARAVLGFTEQLERIGEIAIVVLIGGVLSNSHLPTHQLWFVPVLFLIIRPLSVLVGLLRSDISKVQLKLISWFGIKGIGSLYYLMYALGHGVPEDIAGDLTAITLTVIVISIMVHGISVSPLMRRYYSKQQAGS